MSLLKEFEIRKILKFREESQELVESFYELTFSEVFSEENLSRKNKAELYTFIKDIEVKVRELQSGININSLANSIHRGSKNSIVTHGFCERVCKNCGETYTLSNGSNSFLCLDCATNLAKSIVLDFENFMNK